jgi:hypothetical protein
MNAYAVLGLKTIVAATAATGIWTVSRLRSPIRFEMCLQKERGIVIREIRASFYWKPGRTKRGYEWAMYFTRKSLPATTAVGELAAPSLSHDV